MGLYLADLGVTGLADVGYQFYDSAGAAIGSRTTAGVSEVVSGKGIYGVSVSPASGAVAIYWNSSGTAAAYAMGSVDSRVADLNNLSAAQVNAEVDTALADYDAPTKTELDSAVAPLATAAAVAALNNLSAAQVNAEVDAALADYDAPTKTELDSAVAPLATSAQVSALSIPSAATIADAVWDELLSGHVISGSAGAAQAASGASAAAIADAVWDEALSGHATSGTAGAALSAAGSAGDPWSTEVPGAYAAGTAGALFAKLDVGEAEDTVIVLPGAPTDVTLCRVYGYLETLDNRPAADVRLKFELVAADPAKSNKLLVGRSIEVVTDSQGRVADADGNPYLDLQRNDLITPAGSTWRVTSAALKFSEESFTLADETFDLASLIS